MTVTSFRHSGDIGDVVFSMPTARYLVGENGMASYYLSQWHGHTRVLMNKDSQEFLAPLLESQRYVLRCEMYRGESIVYDFDDFRRYWSVHAAEYGVNLAEWMARTFDVPTKVVNEPWLDIEPLKIAPVVVHRSSRYHNGEFPWKRVLEHYKRDIVVVGLKVEHDQLCGQNNLNLPFYQVKDALELAQVIAGCQLFIGNQSLPHAIAEGLKKPKILEVSMVDPNCVFERKDAQYVFTRNVYLPELNENLRNKMGL